MLGQWHCTSGWQSSVITASMSVFDFTCFICALRINLLIKCIGRTMYVHLASLYTDVSNRHEKILLLRPCRSYRTVIKSNTSWHPVTINHTRIPIRQRIKNSVEAARRFFTDVWKQRPGGVQCILRFYWIVYTACARKKPCHFIFDCNSCNSWPNFIIFSRTLQFHCNTRLLS